MTAPAAVDLYRQGCELVDEKNWPEAIKLFGEAIALDDGFRAAYSRKAKCELYIIRNEIGPLGTVALPTVVNTFKKAISLPFDETVALPDAYKEAWDYYNLAIAYEELEELANADAEIVTYLRLCPYEFDAVYERGNIKWKQGEKEDAARFYREAIKINPRSLEARGNLAEVLLSLGRLGEAESWALRAIADKSGEWVVRSNQDRWHLYDTLATTRLAMAVETGEEKFFRDALGPLDIAVKLIAALTTPMHIEGDAVALCYLKQGVCKAQLNDIRGARRSMSVALYKASNDSEVALACRRNLDRLRDARLSWTAPLGPTGLVIAFLALAVLAFSAYEFVKSSLNSAAFAALAIACLGGVVLGVLLPRLTSFKVGGTEATLGEQVVFKTAMVEVSSPPPKH